MERLAIPPDVGVWAPMRGRKFFDVGTGLPYCDGYRTATFYLRTDLRRDICDLLDRLFTDLLHGDL